MKTRRQRGYTLIELMVVVMLVIFGIIVPAASIYVTGSLITSGIKSGSKECNVEYGIEPLFDGDWFCPEEKNGN